MKIIYIFDATKDDPLGKVRGAGRYLQILKENLAEAKFVSKTKLVPNDSILVNPFFNIISLSAINGRVAKKQIAVIHDLIPLKYPSRFPLGLRGNYNVFLNKFLLRNYDHFVTDSLASKKDIVNLLKIPENKITVIYPTAPKIFFEKNNKNSFKPPVAKYCLYVGDATWNKNRVNLARAIKKINVTGVFVGRVFEKQIADLRHPWQRELRLFLEEIKDDKRFIFPGFIEDYKLVNFYEQASCNVLLSHDEGFGFSFLESAILGTPSVMSDIPVFREISGEAASLANPDNIDEIAKKIEEIYSNEAVRKSWKIKALARAKYFSPAKFSRGWNEVFEKV